SALLGLELAVSPIARRLASPSAARAMFVRRVAYGAALVMVLWTTVSPWMYRVHVSPLDRTNPVTSAGYVAEVERAGLQWLRFGTPDNLTSATFWGGFGWLEVLLPATLISILAGASGLA